MYRIGGRFRVPRIAASAERRRRVAPRRLAFWLGVSGYQGWGSESTILLVIRPAAFSSIVAAHKPAPNDCSGPVRDGHGGRQANALRTRTYKHLASSFTPSSRNFPEGETCRYRVCRGTLGDRVSVQGQRIGYDVASALDQPPVQPQRPRGANDHGGGVLGVGRIQQDVVLTRRHRARHGQAHRDRLRDPAVTERPR